MRGLSVVDVLIIVAVLGLLLYAGSHDFVRYDARSATPPTPSPSATALPGA